MSGVSLLIYSLLLLAVGGVIGAFVDHFFKSAQAHKHASISLLALGVVAALIILVSVSSIPGTVHRLIGGSAAAETMPAHQRVYVVPTAKPAAAQHRRHRSWRHVQ